MQSRTTLGRLAAVALGLLAGGFMAGCTLPPSPETDVTAKPTTPAVSIPAASDEESSEAPSVPPATDPGEAAVLQPGESTTGAGVVPFTDGSGNTTLFAHQLVSVELAPAGDVETLTKKLSQIKGMDVWYLRVESRYVSGDNTELGSIYSDLVPVTASGDRARELTLIGWDSCPKNSIPMPGDDPSVVFENCRAAVAAPAGDPPVAIAWSDSDAGYELSKGKAAYFRLP
ncbi:MAG: hypothetical protein KIT69_04190 [Propionibacteriaceae bacterium]|nr:hypothetical protein [Propionibacteriaceae bacterium]